MTSPLTVVPTIFDLELSGKCNTVCTFCPRHEMKRGEEFMSEENFNHFFARLKDYVQFLNHRDVYLPYEKISGRMPTGQESPVRVILCGMGESILHKKCTDWVSKMRREIGIRVTLVTNGLLLTETNVAKLREADITVILVSVPGIDRESYARTMKLDWDRIIATIERAHELFPGRVQINATVPDHSNFTADDVIGFWSAKGIPIAGLSTCHNRGGFLTDNNLTGEFAAPSDSFCGIYARHNFIAWDGRILSCCHDLHAENVLGHVSTHDFMTIAEQKTPDIPSGPKFRLCANCNDRERCHPAQIFTIASSAQSIARS